jgi:nicotinamide mononucleotide (NMN) deamidase PncC
LGTSGSDEGVFGQAEGVTWIALAGDDDERTARTPYGGSDEQSAARISNQALSLLWRHLKTAS